MYEFGDEVLDVDLMIVDPFDCTQAFPPRSAAFRFNDVTL